MNRKIISLIAIFLSSLLLVFIWFINGYIMGSGESGLPFYNLSRQFNFTKFSWAPPALGNSIASTLGAIPFYWFFSKLESLGISGSVNEAILFFLTFSVSGFSMFFLTHELFPKLQNKYLILSVLFYWFNPFSLVNVWNRFLYSHMLFWAFLPLFCFLFIRGILARKYIFSILASLSTFLFSYALSSPAFSILTILLALIIFLFFIIIEKKYKFFLIKYLALTITSFIFFNFWWISQFFIMFIQPQEAFFTNSLINTNNNLLTFVSLSKELGNLIYITRLAHKVYFMNESPVLAIFGFFVPIVIFITIYRNRKERNILFCAYLFVITLFLIKGSEPPFGEVSKCLFERISVLQVFRNPFEKIGFLLPLSAAPIFAYGISDLATLTTKLKRVVFLSLAFGGVIILWGFPFWTKTAVSYDVEVPQYYQKADEFLSRESGAFRFLSLPIDGEGITYTWEKPYSGVELSSTLFSTSNISFNTALPFYSSFVDELTKYEIDKGILNFIPFFSGKYIVLRDDIDFMKRGMANPEVIKKIFNEWEREGLVNKKFEDGKLRIYEVDKDLIWTKIYVADELFFSNGKDLSDLVSISPNFPHSKLAVTYRDNKDLLFNKVAIVPEDIFLQRVTTPLPKDLSDNDILAKLFHSEHLPGSFLYPFTRLKETLQSLGEEDPDGVMLLEIGFLGKRAAEVYKLSKANSKGNLLGQAEKSYQIELQRISPKISGFINLDNPVSNVVKNSLLYQFVLLERVNSHVINELGEVLALWGVKPKFELPVSEDEYIVYSFEIPKKRSFDFNIRSLKNAGLSQIYLDGLVLKKSFGGDNVSIDLDKGEHEIAVVIDKDKIFQTIYELDSEIFSETSPFYGEVKLPNIPAEYRISFDYRFVKGGAFKIGFFSDIDDVDSPTFFNTVQKDKEYHDWRHWGQEFTTRVGASRGVLKMLPAQRKVCSKKWWGGKSCGLEEAKFEVEIRNFKLSVVKIPQVKLVSDINQVREKSTSVVWEMVDPTLYKVHIKKLNSKPDLLVFSELFNQGWQAIYEDGTKISSEGHFPVNVYANGWLINRPGEYELKIFFSPQSIFETGEIISAISIVSSLVFVGLSALRKK